jgi:hypothetical protein
MTYRGDYESQLIPYLILTIPSQIPDWFEPLCGSEPPIPDAVDCSPAARVAANHYIATGEIDASGLCADEVEEFCDFLTRCSDYKRNRNSWLNESQEAKFWQWRCFYIDRMLTEITTMLSLRAEFEGRHDDGDE